MTQSHITFPKLTESDFGHDIYDVVQVGEHNEITVLVVRDDDAYHGESLWDRAFCEEPIEVIEVDRHGVFVDAVYPVEPQMSDRERKSEGDAYLEAMERHRRLFDAFTGRRCKWGERQMAALAGEEEHAEEFHAGVKVFDDVPYVPHPDDSRFDPDHDDFEYDETWFASPTEYFLARLDMRWVHFTHHDLENRYVIMWSHAKLKKYAGEGSSGEVTADNPRGEVWPGVDTLTHILDGDVYGYRVFKTADLYDMDEATQDDIEDHWIGEDNIENEDACWGFAGPEKYCRDEGVAVAEAWLKHEEKEHDAEKSITA